MFEFVLDVNQSNQRFDKVLKKYFKEASSGFIYKMLRKKNITLNHMKATGGEKTSPGDTVQCFFSEETYQRMRGEQKALPKKNKDFPEIPVLYEDNDVCVLIKPPGVLSQKAVESDYSVNEWIIENGIRKGLLNDSDFEYFRPSICNRLDRNTGGIMCAGISLKGLQILSEVFHDRTVEKHYYALVKGQVKEPQDVKGYLVKDGISNRVKIYQAPVYGCSEIRTSYTPVRVYKDRTLLDVHLHTGKTHQIRAHLATMGHPILGDPKYGDQKFNMEYGIYFQCLYAFRLVFPKCELKGISEKEFKVEVPKNWPLGIPED